MGHRGAPFENTVANHFKKLGYRTMRSYASLGIWDVLAFKKAYVRSDFIGYTYTDVLEIQVKGTPYEFKDEDKAALKAHAEEIGARGVYAYGDKRGKTKSGKKRVQRKVVIEYL
jgi:hypothetical protein